MTAGTQAPSATAAADGVLCIDPRLLGHAVRRLLEAGATRLVITDASGALLLAISVTVAAPESIIHRILDGVGIIMAGSRDDLDLTVTATHRRGRQGTRG